MSGFGRNCSPFPCDELWRHVAESFLSVLAFLFEERSMSLRFVTKFCDKNTNSIYHMFWFDYDPWFDNKKIIFLCDKILLLGFPCYLSLFVVYSTTDHDSSKLDTMYRYLKLLYSIHACWRVTKRNMSLYLPAKVPTTVLIPRKVHNDFGSKNCLKRGGEGKKKNTQRKYAKNHEFAENSFWESSKRQSRGTDQMDEASIGHGVIKGWEKEK